MSRKAFFLCCGVLGFLISSACGTSVPQRVYIENQATAAYITATVLEDRGQLLAEEVVRKNISNTKTLLHVHVQVQGASDTAFPFHRGNFSLLIPATGEIIDESPLTEELFSDRRIIRSTMLEREQMVEGELFFEVDRTISGSDVHLQYESVDKEQKSKIYQLW